MPSHTLFNNLLLLKSVHFKITVARSSFCSKFMIIFNWNRNKVSWCIIENDHSFEQNEDRVTVFLKWTGFNKVLFHLRERALMMSDFRGSKVTLKIGHLWFMYTVQFCINLTKPRFQHYEWRNKMFHDWCILFSVYFALQTFLYIFQ